MLIRTRRVQSPKKKNRSYEVGTFSCDACGKEFERKIVPIKLQNAKENFCSRDCCGSTSGRKNKGRSQTEEWKEHMSIQNSGTGNPFYGKHHTKETLERIQETRQEKLAHDPNAYKHCGSKPGDFAGEKNPFYGKKHTQESRQKMSVSRANLLAQGRVHSGPQGIHGYYTSKKTGVIEHHDSIWELLRMHTLDADPLIKSWTKKHGIRIPYLCDGKQRNYVPDFLIEEDDILVIEEVKGYEKSVSRDSKLAALVEYGKHNHYVTRVIAEQELNHLSKTLLSESLSSFFKKVKQNLL